MVPELLRLCTRFYFNFTGHPLEGIFPLGVLSPLYTFRVSAVALLLFSVDKSIDYFIDWYARRHVDKHTDTLTTILRFLTRVGPNNS